MSRPIRITCTCSVCGKKSEQTVLASTNCFGPSDLDTRPPQMMRGTMHWWLQKCPRCGYIAGRLEKPTAVDRQWLSGKRYTDADGIPFVSALARRFYQRYLICIEDGSVKEAFDSALRAAWACDDADDADGAILCRKLALEKIDALIAETEEPDTLRAVKMDLLRRSRQFDRVTEEFSDVRLSEEIPERIRCFELSLCALSDDACYTVADCADD